MSKQLLQTKKAEQFIQDKAQLQQQVQQLLSQEEARKAQVEYERYYGPEAYKWKQGKGNLEKLNEQLSQTRSSPAR